MIDAPSEELRRAARAALDAAALEGHLAVELVDADRIRRLNREHRGKDEPTDVLSFPIDADGPSAGPRELGDVVICPEHTADLEEAVVHGVLHLCGYDHETDSGEMLALQDRVMRTLTRGPGPVVNRSGFVALAGRPNAGKSTLLNRIVGGKVAIVSDKPQTTRRAIRGIATGPDWQLVIVDLPGMQKPRDLLTERMQRQVERELKDADAVLFMLNGEQEVGHGDRFIAQAIVRSGIPAVTVLNKVDRMKPHEIAAQLAAVQELGVPGEVFPASALDGLHVPEIVEELLRLLPEGPPLYPAEQRTDLPETVRIAELVREQALLRTREEVPHAVEVEIDEVEPREDGSFVVRALLWTETESQKGILIGAGGGMVKAIGTAARREVERELGSTVHLDLSVRVRRGWRGDEALLDRLGIE
ncbi:MAG TPA: GTPase Era [Thermoleophilaceae bacterium]|nr:GTPase Era [Thermoleophilaceae bacterium]